MSDTNPNCEDIQSLIAKLSKTAATVDKNDLSGLAKMHGWSETIASSACAKAEQPCPAVYDSVSSVISSLESLILGDADDPLAMIASIQKAVSSLAHGGTAPAESGGGPAGDSPASDAEVAAQLDKVFDEPAPTEPGATPSAEDSPEQPSSDDAPAAEESAPRFEQQPLTLDPKELEFVQGFVEEAGEHIEGIETALLEVERSPDATDKIDDLFRPFHTIKGIAGFLNLRDINSLTHEAETLLDQGRKGEREITAGLIDLIFDVVDVLKVQIGEIAVFVAAPHENTIPQPPVSDMIGLLREVVSGRQAPEGCKPAPSTSADKVGEHLVEQGACAKEVVDHALDKQKSGGGEEKTGKILTNSGCATPRQVGKALRAQADTRKAKSAPAAAVADQSVRIDTAKLDALVDMVGELVIAQTQVGASETVATDSKLAKDVGQAVKIVRDVQELAMAMRMVPIASTFQKMARLVRDVSRKAGKQVELHISGEETELDKNVIQVISDPLVHMIRNAVDHGVEAPEVRQAAGKDPKGNIHISAFHKAGNIVVEIRDDGKGMDSEALIKKAIERGVVQPGEELTDQQAYGLIFAPGFSMAAEITDISGRGVGMDVVKRNIEQLRGKVEIDSELGKGSVFSMRLPLTLAIIDGMVVQVSTERFIIPTITIEQTLRPKPEQITTVQHRGELLQVRGRLIPLIQLGELFGLTGRIDPFEAMVVIANVDDRQVGLVVERLLGQQQVVIKTLGERFENLRGVSGAAILGDGKVGLILEVAGVAALLGSTRMLGERPDVPDETSDSASDLPPVSEIGAEDLEAEAPERVEALSA